MQHFDGPLAQLNACGSFGGEFDWADDRVVAYRILRGLLAWISPQVVSGGTTMIEVCELMQYASTKRTFGIGVQIVHSLSR